MDGGNKGLWVGVWVPGNWSGGEVDNKDDLGEMKGGGEGWIGVGTLGEVEDGRVGVVGLPADILVLIIARIF